MSDMTDIGKQLLTLPEQSKLLGRGPSVMDEQ